MEPVFVRVKGAAGNIQTYPLSAFEYLTHSARGHVYIEVGRFLWGVVECRDEDECLAVEAAILSSITEAVQADLAISPNPYVLDISLIAAEALWEIRSDKDEARAMAEVDALLAAAEQDRETGYDGVRAYHSDVECRGGGA